MKRAGQRPIAVKMGGAITAISKQYSGREPDCETFIALRECPLLASKTDLSPDSHQVSFEPKPDLPYPPDHLNGIAVIFGYIAPKKASTVRMATPTIRMTTSPVMRRFANSVMAESLQVAFSA